MSTPTRKYDFFMVAAEITYLRDGQPKIRRMNSVLELSKAFVGYNDINDVRRAMIGRTCEEAQVEPGVVKDFVVLTISHLGRGTKEEFHQQAQPQSATNRH